ncbi:MAG: universal stress protein [Halobacteriota archaeon]
MSVQRSRGIERTAPFDRILVVTDDSDASTAAARTGVDLADGYGSAVHALFVVDTSEHWDVVVERREESGERAVETVESIGHRRGVDVTKHLRYGTPHAEVLRYIDDHAIDLVVVGSPKHTGFDRVLNPTPVADRVSKGASVPVLVVGPKAGV